MPPHVLYPLREPMQSGARRQGRFYDFRHRRHMGAAVNRHIYDNRKCAYFTACGLVIQEGHCGRAG